MQFNLNCMISVFLCKAMKIRFCAVFSLLDVQTYSEKKRKYLYFNRAVSGKTRHT